MKTKYTWLCVGLVMAFLARDAGAQVNQWWDNNGAGAATSGTWDLTTANWTGSSALSVNGTVPFTNGNCPQFAAGATTNANLTITVNNAVTCAGMAISSSGATYTNVTFTNGNGSGSIGIVAGFWGFTNGGSEAGNMIFSIPITGPGGIIQHGSGYIALESNNTYQAGTELTGGQVIYYYVNGSFGTGPIIVGGNGSALVNNTTNALTNQNNFIFTAPGYAVNMASGNPSNGVPGTTWAGNFSLPGPGTSILETSSTATEEGRITGIISGSGNLTIADLGIMILAGPNTYTGTTSIGGNGLSDNTIVQAGIAENPGVSGPFGVAASPANSISFGGTGSTVYGTLQYSSANQYDYSSRFSSAPSQAYSIDLNGQTVTLASALTSTGGYLTLTNSTPGGVLTLSGANTYNGGTTIDSNVTVNLYSVADTGPSAIGSGNVTLNGGCTINYTGPSAYTARTWTEKASGTNALDVPNGVTLTLYGAVTGASPIVVLKKVDTGTLVLGGTNINDSYGGLDVFGGLVILDRFGTSGNAIGGSTIISNNAELQLSGSDTAGQIYDGSTTLLTIASNGLMDMNGQNNNIYSLSLAGTGNAFDGNGGALINSSALSNSTLGTPITLAASAAIGGAGSLTLISNISIPTVSFTLTNIGSASLTVNAVISGNGSVMQSGTGTLVLSGANTYTNTTTVNGGLLDIGTGVLNSSSGSIATTNVVVNAGVLELDRSVALAPLAALNLPASPANNVNLNFTGIQNILALNFGGSPQASGFWGAPGNASATYTSSAFTGSGLLYVASATNYSNNNTNNNTYYWDPSNSIAGTGSGGTGSWDNSTADWFITGASADSNWINGNIANFKGTAGGTVTLNATMTPSALTFATAGYLVTNSTGYSLNLAGSSGTTTVTVPAGATTIAAPITGSGSQGLLVSGPGTLVLSGANTYSAGTTVSNGATLSVNTIADSGASAIGTSGTMTLSNGSTLTYTGTTTATTTRTIQGVSSTSATISLPNATGNLNMTGALRDISGSTFTVNKTGPGTLTFSGALNNSGFGMNVLGGTVVLGITDTSSSVAAVSGPTTVGAGAELQLGGAGGGTYEIFTGTLLTVSNGGVFDVNGESDAFGTLTLSGAGSGNGALINSLSGSTAIISNAMILAASATIGGAGNITLPGTISISNATYTLTYAGSGTLTVSGVISSNGGVAQSGSGTLTLGAANTYTNTTIVNSGELVTSVAGAIPTASPVTVNGGILDGNVLNSINSTNITVNNGGALELDIAALANPLVVLNLPASPSNNMVNLNFAGVQNVLALNFGGTAQASGFWGATGNASAAHTSPAFTGSGLLYVPGPGVTGYSNGYTSDWDPTHLNASPGSGGTGSWDNMTTNWFTGTGDAAWTNGSIAQFAGGAGTVTLNADVTPTAITFATAGYTITNNGNQSLNVAATNAAPMAIIIPAGTTTIAAPIAGAAEGVAISGPGTLALTGSNTYTGGTTINSGATVSVNSLADAGGSLGTGTVIVSNASVNYTGAGDTTVRVWEGYPGTTNTFNVPNGVTVDLSNQCTVIGSGAFYFNKTGAGTLVIAGANNDAYFGMNLLAGTVILSKTAGAAIGSPFTIYSGATVRYQTNGYGSEIYSGATTPVTIQSGGLFDMNGQNNTISAVSVAGAGISGSGAIVNGDAGTTSTLSGPITLTANTTIGGNGSITLNGGIISGDFSLTYAPAITNPVLTLTGTNTFNGGLNISAGDTVLLNGSNGLSAGTGPIMLGANSTLGVQISVANDAIANPIVGPSSSVMNFIESGVNEQLNSDMSGFTGTLNVPSSAATSGKVQITAATFSINPAATINVAAGGTLYLAGPPAIVIPCTVNFYGTGNSEAYGALRIERNPLISGAVNLYGNTTFGNTVSGQQYAGVISGVIASPTGAYGITFTVEPGTIVLSGANTYSGNTTNNGGIVQLASAENPGVSGPLGEGGLLVENGGALQFTAANTHDYSSRFGNASTHYLFDLNGQTVAFNSPIPGATATLAAGSTIPNGVGTLILGAANTYGGNTSLSNNLTVQLNYTDNPGVSGPLGSSVAAGSILLEGAILQFTGSNQHDYSGRFSSSSSAYNIDVNGQNVTFASALVGSGALNLYSSASGGTLFLGGSNVYAGSTSISSGGTLTISGNGCLGYDAVGNVNKYAGTINNYGALNFATAGNNLLTGVIQGGGSLTQSGTGLLSLAGANTYYGVTLVSAGTLDIASTGSIPGNVTVTGGVLELDNSSALNASAVLTLAASPTNGTVNLNFTGTQVVSALSYGSVAQPPGTYGSLTSGAQYQSAIYTGAGILQVPGSGAGGEQVYWDPSNTHTGTGSGGNGNWDVPSANWFTGTPPDAAWVAGNIPIFAGTAGTVNLNASQLANGLTFVTGGYTLGGSSTLTLDSATGNGTPLITIPVGLTTIGCTVASGVASNAFIIAGPGALALTGLNTFTNPITVTGGATLSFNSLSDSAPCSLGPLGIFGNASSNIITLAGGNLYFNGNSGVTARNLQIEGTTTSTLTVPTGDTLEFDGRVYENSESAYYGLTFTGGGTLILGDNAGTEDNGALGMNILAGTVVINKNSQATAHGLGGSPTALAPGATLQLSGSGNYDLYSGCTLYVSNGAVLDLGGQSDSFGALYIAGNGTGNGALINSGYQPSGITNSAVWLTGNTTVGGSTTSEDIHLASTIEAYNGIYSLTYAGTGGNLYLLGANTFDGGLNIQPNCTVDLWSATGAGDGPINIGLGGTLIISNDLNVANQIIGTNSGPGNPTSAIILNSINTGNWPLSAGLSGFAGTIDCQNNNPSGNGAQVLIDVANNEAYPINAAATWKIENGVTVDMVTPFTNDPAQVQIYGIGNSAYGALRLDCCNQQGNVTLEGPNCQIGSGMNSVPQGPNMISGIIGDNGAGYGFTWMGGTNTAPPGPTLILTAVNTYGGLTVVSNNDCILAIGATGSIASSSGVLLATGTAFDLSRVNAGYAMTASQTLANISGSATINGSLNLSSGTTLNLTNNVTGAPLTVTNGTVTLNNNPVNLSIASSITPTANGFLLISGANGGTVAGNVSSSPLTLNGGTIAPGGSISLQIIGGSLYLVATTPVVFAGPIPSNPIIFAPTNGTTNSVTFSAIVFGAPVLTNHWYLNGAPIAGASNTSVTIPGTAAGSYTVTFGSTNSYATAGVTASTTLTVIAPPTNPFPQSVLALKPIGYWRLNEAEETNNGEDGVICHDYIQGNDGIYSNAILGNPGYDSMDSAIPGDTNYDLETSAEFGIYSAPNSCVFAIPTNVDVSALTNKSATFTVQAWVQSSYGEISDTINTPTVAAKGYYDYEEFTIDCGTHIGSVDAYRFTVRNAGGTLYSVPSTLIAGVDSNWHFLVGVCDEVHSNIAFYIDGTNVGTSVIPALSGIVGNDVNVPMSIGSRSSSATAGFDQQFTGLINDVAIFTNAFTAAQVQSEYYSAGIAPTVSVVTNAVTLNEFATLSLQSSSLGTPNLGIQWYLTDISNNVTVISGQTNGLLTLTNVQSWYANVYVVVTNFYGSVTSAPTYLTVNSGPAFIQTEPAPSLVYVPAGTSLSYSVLAYGADPIYYEWLLNGSAVIPGATNSSYTFTAQIGSNTYTCAVSNSQNNAWVFGNPVTVVAQNAPPEVGFSNPSLWSLQGTGFTPTLPTGGPLEMTSSAGSEGTSAFYEIPQYISNGFIASFTYTPSLGSATRADGTTFCIQNSASGYTALGAGGGDLGVTGISPCFNFNLDLYSSAAGGTGINWATNGGTAQAGGGAPNAGTGSVNINSEDPIAVAIIYNGSNQITVNLTNLTIPSDTYTTNYSTPNLAAALGSVDAYIGFTGGTGGSYAEQQVTGFNFVYTSAHEGPVILNDITPSNMDAPVGAEITYSVGAIGTAPLYYYWYQDGTNVQSGTSSSYTFIAAAGSNNYYCAVSNAVGSNTLAISDTAYVVASVIPTAVTLSNTSLWQLNGNSVFTPTLANGLLTETTATGDEATSAYYTIPQYINNGFVASFTYTPSGGTATRGDGLAFVLQNSASGPFALGGDGGSLGVNGIAPCVNLDLDLYAGAAGGTGINWETNGATAQEGGGLPNAGTGPVNINSLDPINVTIQYEPGLGELQVTLVDTVSSSTYSTNYLVGDNLGAAAGGNAAYVGFTGGSGADDVEQTITNFSFMFEPPVAGFAENLTPLNTSAYVGASITYSVLASGAPPITYVWYVNSNLVVGATNSSYAYSVALGTNYVQCGVSNFYSTNYTYSSIGSVVGAPLPTDPYATNLLAQHPIAYWRLNEIAGSTVAYDYVGGFDGTYGASTTNGQPGIPNPPFLGLPANDLGVWMDDNTASGSTAGFVSTTAINISVSNCTLTCWIYPNGSQADSEGLVFQRGATANGINYGAANEFAYTWDNASATYDWTSGLIIPTDTWSLLALVITPSDAVAYVINTNGVAVATNPVANPTVSLNTGFAIGADPQASTLPARVFNGEMDEVAVFASALSSNQISQLYANAGFEVAPPSPPTLSITKVSTNVVLTWSAGNLFFAPTVKGPWTVTNVTSPYTNRPSTNALFYRAGVPYTP